MTEDAAVALRGQRQTSGAQALARPSVDERKSIILERAAQLFEQHGYVGTSMRDIAEDLGLTKGALYHYFNDKQDILYELHNAFISDLKVRLEGAIVAQEDAREKVRAICHAVVENVAEYRPYVKAFFQEAQHLKETQFDAIGVKREEYAKQVEDCLREGMGSGVFRQDVPARLATMFVFGSLNWTYQWMKPDGQLAPEEIAELFYALLLDGLSGPDGDEEGQAPRARAPEAGVEGEHDG